LAGSFESSPSDKTGNFDTKREPTEAELALRRAETRRRASRWWGGLRVSGDGARARSTTGPAVSDDDLVVVDGDGGADQEDELFFGSPLDEPPFVLVSSILCRRRVY
jgi:hypothetical protein